MNLTVSDKDAFVNAIINDIPRVDYDKDARDLVMNTVIASMPEAVALAYSAHPNWFVSNSCTYMPGELSYVYVPGDTRGYQFRDRFPAVWEELKAISDLKAGQEKKISIMRATLKGAIKPIRTLKQAQERFPEFAKYLPESRDGSGLANLPVIVSIVADLTALGWPKPEAIPVAA